MDYGGLWWILAVQCFSYIPCTCGFKHQTWQISQGITMILWELVLDPPPCQILMLVNGSSHLLGHQRYVQTTTQIQPVFCSVNRCIHFSGKLQDATLPAKTLNPGMRSTIKTSLFA